jgi:peptide-methionine (R)-S-oxide reductase
MSCADDNWKSRLSPEQYRIMREGGTERPFSGEYYTHKADGLYLCACCQTALFDAKQKYDSGSGWPSFWAPINAEAIKEVTDHSHGMIRVEARCAHCDAHLGHVFEDGPQPSGLRYCINSLSLQFAARDQTQSSDP